MTNGKTLVFKIGTSSLTQPDSQKLALSTIAALIETLTQLRQEGHSVVLISSGAVGVGCNRLKLTERPKTLAKKQAIAAVGQGRLMRVYDDLFTSLGQPIAQVLLTRRDLTERSSYVNAYNTFQELFALGVLPIVNENDTVAVEELKFGDNDTLSALVANLIEADWLFLLTDVEGLYPADPRLVPDAEPLRYITPEELAKLDINTGKSGSGWGTGGMVTKLAAARLATRAGVQTVIMRGTKPQNICKILEGEALGTQFAAQPRTENARKRWIEHGLITRGKIYVDEGAVRAIGQQGKSLLAAGITHTEGNFSASEAVMVCNPQGVEIARGLVNYSSVEIQQIQGIQSEKIPDILGYMGSETVIHRDNLVLVDG